MRRFCVRGGGGGGRQAWAWPSGQPGGGGQAGGQVQDAVHIPHLSRHPRPAAISRLRRGGSPSSVLAYLLLAGDRLLGTLASPGVGVRALAVHGQTPPVPDPLVGPDLHLALDVLRNVAAEI